MIQLDTLTFCFILFIPLLGLDALGRHRLNSARLDVVPVGAQAGAVALGEALHHGALLLGRGVAVQLLEEEVDVALVVRSLLTNLVPVLGSRLGRRRIKAGGLFGWGCVCWTRQSKKLYVST